MSRDKKRGGGELPSHLIHACCFICAVTLRPLSCRTTRYSGERNTTIRLGGTSTSLHCPCRKCFVSRKTGTRTIVRETCREKMCQYVKLIRDWSSDVCSSDPIASFQ